MGTTAPPNHAACLPRRAGDADEDAGNGDTAHSSQLTPAHSAEKPTVNALDEIAALVEDTE